MSLNNPRPGFQNTSDYIASGLPWVTSSIATVNPQRLDFFKVTRAFTVRNNVGPGDLYVGFTAAGVTGSNRFAIPAGDSERFEIRAKELWVQSSAGTVDYSLMAELTLIDASSMPNLTASSADVTGGASWQGVGFPVDERIF